MSEVAKFDLNEGLKPPKLAPARLIAVERARESTDDPGRRSPGARPVRFDARNVWRWRRIRPGGPGASWFRKYDGMNICVSARPVSPALSARQLYPIARQSRLV